MVVPGSAAGSITAEAGTAMRTICARDSHGRIARSPEARQEFMTQTGYPQQWQTIAEGKAKDATE
jgi:hypothetical protein